MQIQRPSDGMQDQEPEQGTGYPIGVKQLIVARMTMDYIKKQHTRSKHTSKARFSPS